MTTDYRDTVLMPRTAFPMKARLPEREPAMAARWEEMGLYRRLRETSAGRPKFVLHDGPPYANGHLHLGTALNKILKDVVVRSQQMLSKDSVYVPGWDCHGLPIEWQVEQAYRKEGRDKDSVPVSEFRSDCRAFAEHWIDVQRDEFKRLGVIGDWDDPYTTMTFEAEAQIVRELGRFLVDGSLYRGARPVMWSPVEKTALAEAEIEYHDHTSVVITVAFPVIESPLEALDGAAIVIWTTTPWTIPGNRCIAYGEAVRYLVLEATEVADGSSVAPGARIAAAEELAPTLCAETGITDHRVIASGLPGTAFAGAVCAHPLRGQGYEFPVPLIPADHVTTEQGTGFVHIAPGHGAEDFEAVALYNAGLAAGGSERQADRDAGDGGRRRLLLRSRAGLRRQARLQGERRGRGRAGRRRQPARARQAGPLLPSLLALQGAVDLPQHAPVVHQHGDDRPARHRARGHRPGALGAAGRPRTHSLHDRDPAGLGALASARLGRADHGLRLARGRHPLARCPGGRAHRRSRRDRRRGRLVRQRQGTLPRARARPGRIRQGHRHPRRLVRERHHAQLRARKAAGARCGRRRSTSKARTSIGAGSTARSSNPAARAGARPTTPCSPTASWSTARGARCRNRSATSSRRSR